MFITPLTKVWNSSSPEKNDFQNNSPPNSNQSSPTPASQKQKPSSTTTGKPIYSDDSNYVELPPLTKFWNTFSPEQKNDVQNNSPPSKSSDQSSINPWGSPPPWEGVPPVSRGKKMRPFCLEHVVPSPPISEAVEKVNNGVNSKNDEKG